MVSLNSKVILYMADIPWLSLSDHPCRGCGLWVEFFVGSRPSSEGFSPGSPVFLPPQKSTFLNSNSIGNSRVTGLSVEDCYVLPSLNKVNLFFIYFLFIFRGYH